MVNIHFISFGSDKDYVSLSNKITRNLSLKYPESYKKVYETKDLPDYIINYALKYNRIGYGYYIWKPYIISHYLNNLNYQEVLVYIDGRFGGFGSKSIYWLDKFLKENYYNFLAWDTGCLECHYTTGDLLSYFNLNFSSLDATSGQYAGGLFALRKTKSVINLIDEWKNFLWFNSNLCRDEISKLPNHDLFIENRHDQSVFSLLIKEYYRNNKINLLTIQNKDVYLPQSLQPQFYPHPSQAFNLKVQFGFRKRQFRQFILSPIKIWIKSLLKNILLIFINK